MHFHQLCLTARLYVIMKLSVIRLRPIYCKSTTKETSISIVMTRPNDFKANILSGTNGGPGLGAPCIILSPGADDIVMPLAIEA